MKLPILAVALALCGFGCASVPGPLKVHSAGPIHINIYDDGTEFTITNEGNETLHAISLSGTVNTGGEHFLINRTRIGDLSPGEAAPGALKFNARISQMELTGWCKEGRLKASYDWRFTRHQ